MTPAEITRQFLASTLANTQRTVAHATQMAAEAAEQLARATAAADLPEHPLPELAANQLALAQSSHDAAKAYATAAARDHAAAQARLTAHDQAHPAPQS